MVIILLHLPQTIPIPSGEIRSVKGTPMDFTEMKSIGRDIDVEDEQLKFGTGYDHNFMINGNAHELRLAGKAIWR